MPIYPITDEMLGAVGRIAREYVSRREALYYIFLHEWDGFHLFIDSCDSRHCGNQCGTCLHMSLLGKASFTIAQKQAFPLGLCQWELPDDISLFGPENCKQCKSMERLADCFSRFILTDQSTQTKEGLIAELKLVRDVRVLYAHNDDIVGARTMFWQLVVVGVLEKSDEALTSLMEKALDQLGWNGETWGNLDEAEV